MNGTAALVALVHESLKLGDDESIVNHLRVGLCELILKGDAELPADVFACHVDRYARRLLHRDDERGFSIVAMAWGPGQGTSLHDHSGMWCVEGVWKGSIEVQQYELLEQRDARFRFERRGFLRAGTGSAGCLIPPYEYHLIRNPTMAPAGSVHIYGGNMTSCGVFDPTDRIGWFTRQDKALTLDL